MNESIFEDRRIDLKRRHNANPYGVSNCRRTAQDRRRERSAEKGNNWWLKVNYSNSLN